MDISLQVLKAQSGDREAFDWLLRELQKPLFRCIRNIVVNQELAEDILQEVFLIIHRQLQWLRDPQLIRPWAYRISTREAIRQLRRERKKWNSEEEEALTTLADARVSDPVHREMAKRLPDFVRHLSPGSRAVLVLHYLEELTLAEVSSVLDIPLGTTKSRLAYGLEVLRNRLEIEQAIPESTP